MLQTNCGKKHDYWKISDNKSVLKNKVLIIGVQLGNNFSGKN